MPLRDMTDAEIDRGIRAYRLGAASGEFTTCRICGEDFRADEEICPECKGEQNDAANSNSGPG